MFIKMVLDREGQLPMKLLSGARIAQKFSGFRPRLEIKSGLIKVYGG